MDIQQVLKNTISPDQETRAQAESQLQAVADSNFAEYLHALFGQLGNENAEVEVRLAAGLALKNSFSARDHARLLQVQQRWAQDVPAILQSEIKTGILGSLGTSQTRVGQVIAQVIASIAAIELPRNEWPELMTQLVQFANGTDQVDQRKAALVTIGYICETDDANLRASLSQHSNSILTAVVQGARAEEPEAIRLAALTALGDSLEFVKTNFQNEGERNYIMQVICEATQASDSTIQQNAFGCLARIMGLYYEHMRLYMEEALFMLTVEGMKSPDHDLAKLAVEFWCTVCEEELTIHERAEYAAQNGLPTPVDFGFARIATSIVTPVLLDLLVRSEEDIDDEDGYTIYKASYQCLVLWSQTVGDEIVAPVLAFTSQKMESEDGRDREAAILAFSSTLDGPSDDNTHAFVAKVFNFIIQSLEHPLPIVQNAAAQALGVICETVPRSLASVPLAELLTPLFKGLNARPKVAKSCCWALYNYIPTVQPEELHANLEPCIRSLLELTGNLGLDGHLRTASYEVLAVFIASSTSPESTIYFQQLSTAILARLHNCVETLQKQVMGVEDSLTLDNMQTSLIAVEIAIIQRLGPDLEPTDAQVIMGMMLQMLPGSSPQSSTIEAAFSAIGSLADALGSNFVAYMPEFIGFLCMGLETHSVPSLCSVAVGVASDVTRALQAQIEPFCPQLIASLLTSIKGPDTSTEHHPAVIQCFGSIASSLGAQFTPYLPQVAAVLQDASRVAITSDFPDEMKIYVLSLWESVFMTWDDIILSLGEMSDSNPVVPFLPAIFELLHSINTHLGQHIEFMLPEYEGMMSSAITTLNDIVLTSKGYPALNPYLAHPWLQSLLEMVKGSFPFPDLQDDAARTLNRIRTRLPATGTQY